MSSYVLVVSISLLIFGFLYAALFYANHPRPGRYRQLWSPIVVILLALTVWRLEGWMQIGPVQWVFEQFPVLENYTYLVLNGLLLAFFLSIKVVLRITGKGARMVKAFTHQHLNLLYRFINSIIVRILRLIPRYWRMKMVHDGNDNSVALAYRRGYRDITLKPAWMFPSFFLSYASGISLLIFLLFILSTPFQWHTFIQQMIPVYPALVFLLIAESSWFLKGYPPIRREGTFSGEDVNAYQDNAFRRLYEEFVHEMKPIKSGREERQEVAEIPSGLFFRSLSGDGDQENERLHQTLRRMRNRYRIKVDDRYAPMLAGMMNREDLLVEDLMYSDAKIYIVEGIAMQLMANEKIVIIAKNEKSGEQIRKWFYHDKRYGQVLDDMWTVDTIQSARENNTSPHILIIPIHKLADKKVMDFLCENHHAGVYRTFMLFEGETLLANRSLDLQRFQQVMLSRGQAENRFWVFSKWYEGLEASVRHIFSIKPKDLFIPSRMPASLYYLIWRSEYQAMSDMKLHLGMDHRTFELEVFLAMKAQKLHTDGMYFINHQEAISESFEELLEQREKLAQHGFSMSALERFKERLHVLNDYWELPDMNDMQLFVRDTRRNLVDELVYWKRSGKKHVMVHVISPPYLLRDYFAHTIEYHLDHSRAVSALPTRRPLTLFGKIKPLLDRLSSSWVEEREVNILLGDLASSNEGSGTLKQVHDVLAYVFRGNFAFDQTIDVKTGKPFSKEHERFNTLTYYKIPGDLAKSYPFFPREEYTVYSGVGEVVGTIPKVHLYQHYMIKQVHPFGGELYRIMDIQHEQNRIEVNLAPRRFVESYIHNHSVSLTGEGHFEPKSYRAFTFSRMTHQVQVEIGEIRARFETKGYLSLDESMISCAEDNLYEVISEKEKPHAIRTFERAHAIRISGQFPEGVRVSKEAHYTFAFVLQEMMPSLYPSFSKLVRVTTPLPDDFFSEGKERRYAGKMFADLESGDEWSEEGYSFWIIEDSPMALGVVESMYTNLRLLLELAQDFIYWASDEEAPDVSFLSFTNRGEDTDLYDLEGALQLADLLAGHRDTLKVKRQAYIEMMENRQKAITAGERDADKHYEECSFCERTFDEGLSLLKDGRLRCEDCSAQAVDTVEEARQVYEECRSFLQQEFKAPIRPDVHVKMVSSDEMKQASGALFDPSGPSTVIGLAILKEDRTIEVLIEEGNLRIPLYQTMLHELTHVWQYDNLDIRYLTTEELEGMTTWVELYFLDFIGHEELYGEMLENMLNPMNKSPYARGYRDLMDLLADRPEGMTPFQLYTNQTITQEEIE